MPFVIIFLLIAGSIAIAWLYPQLRALALGVLVLFTVIFLGAWLQSGDEVTQRAGRIAPEEVTLSEVTFTDDPRVARIGGAVLNGSDRYHLREMQIRVTLHDCPQEDSALSDCPIIADDTTTARVDVPAGQKRRFDAVLRFSARPEPEGVLRWRHELVGTQATE